MIEAPIDRSSESDLDRILVFCRPYIIADFRDNVAPLASEYAFSFLTDGRCPGTRDTRDRFYANLASGPKCAEISDYEQDQIRSRCRLLNSIDHAQATALIHAMGLVFSDEIDRIRPHAILCQLVDEYVTHTLAVVAAKREIRLVNYCLSYIPGLINLTEHAHGRAFKVRTPSDSEVDTVVELLRRPRFRQDYRQRKNHKIQQHLLSVARYGVKRAVFSAKAIVEKDPWNLHYAVTPYIAERRRIRDFPRSSDFDQDWRGKLNGLRLGGRAAPVIYLPLSYFPEATTNYWVSNRRIIDYSNCMLEIVSTLAKSEGTVVVVKEHLHMMGARDVNLYRRFMKIPNVISVHPGELSQDVLEASDAVILGTGSIGIEATLLGKPVLSYADSSFWFRASGAENLDLDAIEGWADAVRLKVSRQSTTNGVHAHQFIRAVLESTVRLRARGRKWPLMCIDDLRTVLSRAVVGRPQNEPVFDSVLAANHSGKI
jgi:hypothetical protein